MDGERWQRIREAFEAALELEPDARSAFLDQLGGDGILRSEVEALLAADAVAEEEELLARPIRHLAGEMIEPHDDDAMRGV